MSCKVQQCRFSKSHTTGGHKCSTCNQYGHGQLECGDNIKISSLRDFYEEKLPIKQHCNFIDCKYRWSHNTRSHNCSKCFKNHSSKECPKQTLTEWQRRFPNNNDNMNSLNYEAFFTDKFNEMITANEIKFIDNKIGLYISTNAGMGCSLYIRKIFNSDGSSKECDAFFLHSDMHGQYSADVNDIPQRDIFIYNCENITFSYIDFIKQLDDDADDSVDVFDNHSN